MRRAADASVESVVVQIVGPEPVEPSSSVSGIDFAPGRAPLGGRSRVDLPLPFEHVPSRRRAVAALPFRPLLRTLASATAVLLVIAAGLMAPGLGTFLSTADEPAPSPLTFLSYGVSIRRGALDAGVARIQSGETGRLVLGALNSRDAEYYITPHSSELARDYLIDRGVRPDAVEILPSVASEWEEGQRLRDAAMRIGTTGIEAYAPDFRARRTRGVLHKTFEGTGIMVRVVAVSDVEVRLERWWETRPGINVIYNEYPRLAYYWLLGRLG
jgi:hypothetical protein